MDQELIMKVQFLQEQANEIEQNLELIEREIQDLQKLDSNLTFLINNKEKSSISSIGKGLHLKTNIENKELYVEVGAGVVVKKSPQSAKKVVENQIKKLSEARIHIMGKLDIYKKTIAGAIEEMREHQEKNHHEHTHGHDHSAHSH